MNILENMKIDNDVFNTHTQSKREPRGKEEKLLNVEDAEVKNIHLCHVTEANRTHSHSMRQTRLLYK